MTGLESVAFVFAFSMNGELNGRFGPRRSYTGSDRRGLMTGAHRPSKDFCANALEKSIGTELNQ